MSDGLPSGAPAFAHATIVSFSAWLKRRSLRNWPWEGSACHGGIVPLLTWVAIDFAHGRASLNVSSDIGAISPGRWQLVQFLKKIGATSLEKVAPVAGAVVACAPSCAEATAAITDSTAAVTVVRIVIPENSSAEDREGGSIDRTKLDSPGQGLWLHRRNEQG